MSSSLNDAPNSRTANRESNARSYSRRFPICVKKANGIYLEDMDGNRYIDCLANAGTLALGHNNKLVGDAICEFVKNQRPLQTLDLTTEIKDEFVSTLFSVLPKEFQEKYVYCDNNFAALKALVLL